MDDAARIVTELYLRRRARGLTHKEAVCELADHYADDGPDLMTLVRWEHRRREPRGCHVRALLSYHRVDSIAELGLGHKAGAAANWTWATEAEIDAEIARRRAAQILAKETPMVDRRTVVQGVVTGVGAVLLPVGPLVQAAQLLGGRPSIGLGDVQAAEGVATHLASRYSTNPNDETRAAAVAHARTLTDRLKQASMTSTVRTRLTAVASDATALAAATKRNAGRLAEADVWFNDAIALAREAGDRRLETLAIVDKAWTPRHLLGSGDRPDSLPPLRAAAELDRYLSAAGRAFVHGYLARGLATGGDDSGSGHALERALAAAALVSREEPGWGYWSQHANLSGWDGARPGVFAGLRPLYLGRYREAIPLFESALGGTSVPLRRASLHVNLSQASAGLGDRDEACAAAIAALDETKPYGLGAIRDDIRAVRAGFPSVWDHSSALAELDERLAVI